MQAYYNTICDAGFLFLASWNLLYIACPNVASTVRVPGQGKVADQYYYPLIICDVGYIVQLLLASCCLLYIVSPNVASTDSQGAWLGQSCRLVLKSITFMQGFACRPCSQLPAVFFALTWQAPEVKCLVNQCRKPLVSLSDILISRQSIPQGLHAPTGLRAYWH